MAYGLGVCGSRHGYAFAMLNISRSLCRGGTDCHQLSILESDIIFVAAQSLPDHFAGILVSSIRHLFVDEC